MKNGTITVEIAPLSGAMRELTNGQVLARPGQVYRIRIKNHAPRRAVADVSVDGKCVSGSGLVIAGYGTLELERPTRDGETGRFTVIREGDEVVFGESGGRDNPALGLIEVNVRYELEHSYARPLPFVPAVPVPQPIRYPWTGPSYPSPFKPMWGLDPFFIGAGNIPMSGLNPAFSSDAQRLGNAAVMQPMSLSHCALRSAAAKPAAAIAEEEKLPQPLGAAGTGLTGESDQRFRPVFVGELEDVTITVRLRLTIGREADIIAARPLVADNVPPRPAAQPGWGQRWQPHP